MKKIVMFLAVMVFFLVGTSFVEAQNKTVYTGSYPWEGVMMCTDDYASGTESYVVTEWGTKWQFKYEGHYVGESGKHYSWRMVQNWHWKTYKGKAYTETNTGISIIKCEGVPIAMAKTTYHITYNGKGELVVEVDNGSDDWICLD
ncbi:hypothetical protein [Draconibacterium halophilum]|uniref:Uncharacterized protein n=1 Tax=Draconibacterium halophilum TaxID=2706887 RepID=A0A6C0R8R0_9BACT|nr:hypothetical protein [Draconibacterium halophilum]QIA06467.1 hypothetical protein G0Q07_01400 [Draconibacterium halophilum]